MRFSVIIPAHNAAGFIAKALESVERQSFTDYEVLVVADKCTDDTAHVVRGRGLAPIVSDGGAPGLARNAGIDRAQGDYLLFLDADDWFLVDSAFQRISDGIDSTGAPHLLHYGFMWGPHPCTGLQPGGGHWHHVWSRAWHRDAIGTSRMPPLPAGQDTVFTLSVAGETGLDACCVRPSSCAARARSPRLGHPHSPCQEARRRRLDDERSRELLEV